MPTIDKRIVEMQFNNKQFEQGVAQSLKSLARLNDALELDQHLDSIERLKNTMDHLDFNQLNKAAENINSSFTVVGKIINDTKQRIADFVENGINRFVKSVKDLTPTALGLNDWGGGFLKGEGFNKYAEKTKAVQTIMSATGKSVEEVNAVLKDLMDYTDMTSYDFTEMVKSIGKFTSVGQDLAKSEKAMEGIANWAAISGADKTAANHVMYNLSQAMGAGVVKLMDWRSVMNMNMATKEFKEEVIKAAIAAGTLQKKSDGVGKIMKQTKKATKKTAAEFKEIEVNYKNFDQALSEGFFTSDVLMTVLEKYANKADPLGAKAYEAAKVALTFKDAVDAIKDALSSGWSRTYEALFGNVKEAGDTWTGLCDAIIEFIQIFSDYRNTILESWHEMGGFNDMLEAASNLWQTFMNIVDMVGESIHKVFPMLESNSITKMLVDATKSLKDLTAGWLELSGGKRNTEEETKEIEKQTAATKKNTQANKENATSLLTVERSIEQGLKRGARGSQVKEMQETLLKAGMHLDKYGADGIFGPETQAALKQLQKKLGVEQTGVWDKATNDAAKKAGYLKKTLSNTAKIVSMDISKIQDGLKKGMRGDKVKEMQKQLMAAGYKLDKYGADGIFGSETQAALKKLQKDLGVKQTGVWDKATQDAIKNAKKMKKAQQENIRAQQKATASEKEKKANEETKKDGKETNDIFTRLQNIVTGIFSALKIAGGVIAGVGYFVKKLVGLAGLLIDPIISILSAIGLMVTGFEETLAKDGTLALLFDTLDQMFAPLENGIKSFADAISNFFGKNKNIKSFADLWIAIKKEVSENEVWMSIISVFENIGSVAGKLFGIVRNLGEGFGYMVATEVITTFNWIVENLPGAILIISNTLSGLIDTISNSEFVKTIINDIVSAFSGVIGLLGKAGTAIKDFFKKNKNIKNFGDLWKALNKELSKHKGWQAISKILTKVGELFTKVRTKFKGFYDTAKKTIGDGLKKAFSWITTDFPGIILKVVEFGEKMVDAAKNSETLKKAWEGISGFFKTTFGVIKGLADDLWGSIKKFFFDGEDSVDGPFEKLKKKIDEVKEKISGFGKTVSEKLKDIYESSEFIRTLYDNYLEPFWKRIKKFATLLKEGIIGFATTDTSDVEGFGNKLKKRLKAFEPLVEFITGIGDDVREAIKGLISSFSFENLWMTLLDGFNIFGSAKAEGGSGSIYYTEEETGSGGVFDRIIENVKGLLKKVSGIDIASFVSEKLESVGMDGPKLASFIMKSLGFVALFKIAKGISGIGKGFKFGGKGLLEFGTGFKDLGKDIGGSFKSFSSTVGGSIKDFLLGTDGKGSLGDMVVNFTKEMAKAKNQRPKDSIGTTFLKLSTSLLIVAGAIALISTIKHEELEKNIGIFIGVVVGLGSMVGLLGLEGDNIEKLGHGILAMSGALALLVAAIEGMALVVQFNDPDILSKSLEIIRNMMLLLGGIELAIAKAGGIGGDKNVINVKLPSILSMCAGVGILVLAVSKMVKIIESTSAETFDKAFDSIKSLLTRLGEIEVALALLGRNKGNGVINVKLPGILSMCAGIYILALAVSKMVNIIEGTSIETFDKAFDSIKSLLTRLGEIEVALALLGRNKGNGVVNVKIGGILSMCAGILLLTFAIDRVVEGMKRSTKYEAAFDLVKSMLTRLGEIEIGIAWAGKGSKGFKVSGILTMCAGIALMVYAVCKLADVYDEYERTTDSGQKFNRLEQAFDLVKSFMTRLAITTKLMGSTIKSLSTVPISAGATAAVNIVEFGSIIVGAIAGLAALFGGINDGIKEITDGFDLGEWLGDKLAAFGNGMGRFIGGILVGIQHPFENGEDVETKSLAENIEDLGTSLSKALESFMPLLDKVQGISQTHVTGITNFTKCLLAMTGADLVDSIAAFIGGKKGEGETGSAFVDFAYQLVALCAPLTKLGPAAKDINNDDLLTLVPIMDTLKSVAESVTTIGWEQVKTTIFDTFSKGDGILGMFPQLRSTIIASSRLVDAIKKYPIDTNVLLAMEPVFSSLHTIAQTVTDIQWEQLKTNVFKAFSGDNDIVSFADAISDAAPDLLKFAVYSNKISQYASGIEGTSTALTAIANAAKAVPETGGWIQKIVGEHDVKSFGDQLGALGAGLTKFYLSTMLIPKAYDATGATTALQAIIDVAENIPKVNGVAQVLFGSISPKAFGDELGDLGAGLAAFIDKTKGITGDSLDVSGAVGALTSIASLEEGLEKHGGLAQWFSGDNDLLTFADNISQLGDKLHGFSNNVHGLDYAGMQASAATLKFLAEAFDTVPYIAAGDQGYVEMFNNILDTVTLIDTSKLSNFGQTVVRSIINGFYTDSTTPLADAFGTMMASANTKIRDWFDTFKNAGSYLMQGVKSGIEKGESDITNAIRTTLSAGIKAAAETWDEHSPSKVGKWLGKYWDLGIAQGVLNYGKSISNTIEGTLNDGFETAKTTWDEHSNSKKGIWLGEFFDGGVVEGILNHSSDVSKAMSSVFGDSVDIVKDIFGDNADVDSILNNLTSMTTDDFNILPDDLKTKYEALLDTITDEGTSIVDGITGLDDKLTEATKYFGFGMTKNIKNGTEEVDDSLSLLDKWLSESASFRNEQVNAYEKATRKETKSDSKNTKKDSKVTKNTFKTDKEMQDWVNKVVDHYSDRYFVDESDYRSWAGKLAMRKASNADETAKITRALKEANKSHLVDVDKYKEISDAWVKENIVPGEKYFKSTEALRKYAEKQAKLQSDDAEEIAKIRDAIIADNSDHVLKSNEWDMVEFHKYGFDSSKYKKRKELFKKATAQNRVMPFLENFDQLVSNAFEQANKMYPNDENARNQYFDKLVEIGKKFIKRPGYDYGQRKTFRNEKELQQWAWTMSEDALKNGVVDPNGQYQYAEELIKNNMSKVVEAVKQVANDKLIVEPTIRPVIDAENATITGNPVQKDITGTGNYGKALNSVYSQIQENFRPAVSAAKASEIGINDVKSNMFILDENMRTLNTQQYQGLKDLTNVIGGNLKNFANMSVYIDGRTLLGYLTPRLDRSMGNATVLAGRMN